MSVIEALIVIGGIVGIAAVCLSVSGKMTKWWSSALYALLTTSLALLMVAGFYALIQEENNTAILWYARVCAASVIVALACLYFLAQELVDSSEQTGVDRNLDATVIGLAGGLFVLSFTPAVLTHAATFSGQREAILYSSWGAIPYIIFTIGIFVLIGYQLVKIARSTYRRQYGTIDLRFVFVRTLSYLLTIATVAFIFTSVSYLLSLVSVGPTASPQQLGPVAVVAAVLAALALQPIRKMFNRLTDGLFYHENYSIDDFTVRISQTLNSTNDVRTLLERTSEVVADTIKTTQAFFYVELPEGRHISGGTDGHSKLAAAEFVGIKIGRSSHATVFLPLQYDVNHPMRRMMASHRLGLVMQLAKGESLVGYLCLGRSRRSGYTSRDIRALRTIADELAIAIQNALSVDEVKKLNDTLEQRVDSATRELRASNAQLQRLDEAKDEFISMASHQLRTPLTSIKGYISMLLEGDAGKITKEQKHFLNEAFVSSERMVRLIGDFLNVSRLQTGRFVIEKHPVDLAQLVQREIDSLEQNAAARGVKFTYKLPKSIPVLALDENKIQQVVMNFSDNAIYYSREKSKVLVSLKKGPGYVEFKVVDTGIGVPKEEQPFLFNKFFRATNARRARPDGTGVGLFLAKKVIDDHDGTILFESKEGKGSTFGFRLPIR